MFGWLAGKTSADFHNFYGQTAGLNGPNHGFTIWNQWLGEDRYVPRTDLSTDEMKAMQIFFAAWSDTFQKPLLNKNNRNTDCLDQLSRGTGKKSRVSPGLKGRHNNKNVRMSFFAATPIV